LSGRAVLKDPVSGRSRTEIDVFFPIAHGTFGEDGSLQGFLRLLDVPFVGAGVLGSAIGMDKDVMKRLLRDGGIPIARFVAIREADCDNVAFEDIASAFGTPFFVKPANMGSSVGISKVFDAEAFEEALAGAFLYDRKVLVEEYVRGREIECSVLGNDTPRASVPGEIIVNADFYSYEAKYLDENGAALEIPAKIDDTTTRRVQELAVATFRLLECSGMARVDFFLKADGSVIVNELNTLPGFTRISMYPKLWEASGVSYPQLLEELVRLAVEQHAKESKLKRTYGA
jgi:D-alanine-D-alanine ligase